MFLTTFKDIYMVRNVQQPLLQFSRAISQKLEGEIQTHLQTQHDEDISESRSA